MNSRYKILLIGGILSLLYFQTFLGLLNSWLHNPFYSHGVLVPLISLVIIWSKRDKLKNISKEKEVRGMYIFAFGLILYVIGTLWKSIFLLGLSLIPVLAGLILNFYGKKFMRELLFPVCFLIFMVPLPGLGLELVSINLQHFTAEASVWLSQNFGFDVYKNNLDIYTPNCAIVIGEVCSGLRSIISLLTLAAIFAYIITGSTLKKFIILFAAVPIAIAANTIRVTSAIVIASSYSCEAATTFFHDYSSIFLFVTALILLIIFAKILKCDFS